MIYTLGITSSSFTEKSFDFISSYFKDIDLVQVDLETSGMNPHNTHIVTLQLGTPFDQFVIDVRNIPILLFKELLESKTLILHNAKFDYKHLIHAGIYPEKIIDTMLTEIVIKNGYYESVSLKNVVLERLGVIMDKEVRAEFHTLGSKPLEDKHIQYAAIDVEYLEEIHTIQTQDLIKYQLQDAASIEWEALKVFAAIEYNGMYLDRDEWTAIANRNESKLLSIQEKMDTWLLDNKIITQAQIQADLFTTEYRKVTENYNSPDQLLSILNKVGLEVEDTSDRTLQKQSHPFIDMVLEYREVQKKVSTYGKSFLSYINKKTGRVHTDFWQIKETYRVGSGSKKANAPNVQNIPSSNEYRNCFKPRPNYKWVSIDYSSQELRIMADFSGEEEFINALNNNEDLHCFAYNKMTGENITKEDKEKRSKAKTINFGKPYGMSPFKLADTLNISVNEAKKLFDQYAEAFPKLNKYLKEQAEFGKRNYYIPINHIHKGRRWFKDLYDYRQANVSYKEIKIQEGIVERASMNTPIQGTAAVAVKNALVNLRKYLIKEGLWQDKVYIICTVHDQIDFEVHQDYLHIIPDLERIMIEAGNKYVTKVNMEVDTTITDKWQK